MRGKIFTFVEVLVRSRRRIWSHGRTKDLWLLLVEVVVMVVILLDLSRDRVDGHAGGDTANTHRFLRGASWEITGLNTQIVSIIITVVRIIFLGCNPDRVGHSVRNQTDFPHSLRFQIVLIGIGREGRWV